jgi:hypothetical protein
MRRPLALVLAAALVVPALARAEPLDLDLVRLGAPSPQVQAALAGRRTPSAADVQAASDAKKRFALLSTEVALAFSSPLLQPASTTGHAGFDLALEVASVGVHPEVIGGIDAWPTRSMDPHELSLASIHVRKALPFSFELGGRMTYLSQSSYVGGQIEAKWALEEGFDRLPDIALRGAWTQVFGQKDWNLGTGELDLIVSKRWGVNAVTSFTPYLAARYSWLDASSDAIAFQPASSSDPTAAVETQAAFPGLHGGFYRTTLGVRMTASLVSLAAEATYLGGSTHGESSAGEDDYPRHRVPSSWGGAFRFGFEF